LALRLTTIAAYATLIFTVGVVARLTQTVPPNLCLPNQALPSALTGHHVRPNVIPLRVVQVAAPHSGKITVAVSHDDIDARLGLSCVRDLTPNTGLATWYRQETPPTIDTMRLRLMVEALWIDPRGSILRIDRVAPRDRTPIPPPPEASLLVELGDGDAALHGLNVGVRLALR